MHTVSILSLHCRCRNPWMEEAQVKSRMLLQASNSRLMPGSTASFSALQITDPMIEIRLAVLSIISANSYD